MDYSAVSTLLAADPTRSAGRHRRPGERSLIVPTAAALVGWVEHSDAYAQRRHFHVVCFVEFLISIESKHYSGKASNYTRLLFVVAIESVTISK